MVRSFHSSTTEGLHVHTNPRADRPFRDPESHVDAGSASASQHHARGSTRDACSSRWSFCRSGAGLVLGTNQATGTAELHARPRSQAVRVLVEVPDCACSRSTAHVRHQLVLRLVRALRHPDFPFEWRNGINVNSSGICAVRLRPTDEACGIEATGPSGSGDDTCGAAAKSDSRNGDAVADDAVCGPRTCPGRLSADPGPRTRGGRIGTGSNGLPEGGGDLCVGS